MLGSPSHGLPQLAFRRPLASIGTAVEMLDRSAAEVMALIEEGRLRFAWNIGGRRVRNRTVRILTQSLREFQSDQPTPNTTMEHWCHEAESSVASFWVIGGAGKALGRLGLRGGADDSLSRITTQRCDC